MLHVMMSQAGLVQMVGLAGIKLAGQKRAKAQRPSDPQAPLFPLSLFLSARLPGSTVPAAEHRRYRVIASIFAWREISTLTMISGRTAIFMERKAWHARHERA